MSATVRCSIRSASSGLPLSRYQASRSASSALMLLTASCSVGLRRDVVAVGVEPDLVEPAGALAGERVELGDALDLVAEHRQAPGAVLEMGREDLDRVALGAEGAAGEVELVAAVLQLDQGAQQPLALDLLALLQGQRHPGVGLGRADAVDAGDRGHDDDVVALEQGARRRVAHPVDLLVDARGLLDVGVGARDVGFRLIVVVVADEILDRVVGEERLELAVELGRQDLVRRQHDRRALHLRDDVRHGEGLARAGHAQQHLVPLLPPQALDQLDDRLRLVAGRLELGDQLERPPALGPLDQIGIAGQRLEQVERGQAFDRMHGVAPRVCRAPKMRLRRRLLKGRCAGAASRTRHPRSIQLEHGLLSSPLLGPMRGSPATVS